ncbi:Surface-exposed protein, partial [Paraburkholderia sp. SIMBA_054]
GGALTNLDGRTTQNTTDIATLGDQIANGGVGLVQQDATSRGLTVGAATDGTSVDFTGTDGARVLTGVDAGEVSATSTDAINGSQLNATNLAVTAVDGAVDSLGAGVASSLG